MKPIRIEADAIRAVHWMPSTDPARVSIAGVHLDARGRVIASDGAVAGVFRDGHDGKVAMTIPTLDNKDVRNVFKRVAMKSNADPAIVTKEDDGVYRIEGNGAYATFEPIESPFPNIDNVFPPESAETDVSRIAFNPALLARFPTSKEGGLRMRFNGQTRAIHVTCEGEERFSGLLMPVKDLEWHTS